ncbi:Ig-like domain-containing protein [Brevibacillus parabrevis]|uniref:Ig-like domain-containing protein n=1 Tax=Brevibacillus parabrevis TaxID=54914 RepID=UPI002E21C0DD|nr:hypothetical protein [Brevibacillus parabrevis]
MAATTVVNAAYDTSGNGGRKLVKLSNGWLVAAVVDTTNGKVLFYKSTDNGQSWAALCNYSTVMSVSIASYGTKVYFVGRDSGNASVKYGNFDAATVANTTLTPTVIESGSNIAGNGVTLAINSIGTELHVAYSGTVSAYPNSYNIRYAKGTIDGSGNVTWGSVMQVTTVNTSGNDFKNPAVVVKDNGFPAIITGYAATGVGTYRIYAYSFNGSSWSGVFIYDVTTYAQSNPCAVVDGNGVIHVVWHGLESGSSYQAIRYAKSSDGGATWSAMLKISFGNADRKNPVIAVDNSNKLTVLYTYSTSEIRKNTSNDGVTWAYSTNDPAVTTSGSDPNIMSKESNKMIGWIYKDGAAGAVKFDSIIFNTSPTLSLTSLADNQTLTEGATYTLSGTVSDTDAGQALSVKYSIGGGPTQSIALGTSDGTTAKSFSKTLTYSAGRFWDGSTDVSGLLPSEASSIQIWVNDGSDDSAKATRSFTVVQEDGKMYVPVNVVNQAYLVSQMAPPVRLSNGWLVGAIIDQSTGTIRTYKSTDNGKTWTVFVTNFGGNMTSVVTCGDGDYFTVIYATASGTIAMRRYKSDGTLVYNNGILDAAQTAVNSVTIGSAPDGSRLWWAASTKNSTYPNSYNIRAGSIPINADGTLGTPGAVSQVTTQNYSGFNAQNPSLVIRSNGLPALLFDWNGSGDGRICYNAYSGTAWSTVTNGLATNVAYGASSKTIFMGNGITTPNGKSHAVWHGVDGTDTVNNFVRYSNTSDGITWLTTHKKLVVGTNPVITSDKNGKLTIHYEDGGYIKRIESTNEFTSYQGPFVVGAGTVPASFYDPTFTTDFSVPPTFYQVSGAVKYYGVLNLNKKPVVTLTTPDNQTLTENATLSVAGITLDGDPGNVVTTWYKINSGPARALQSGISDGSTPLSFARDLSYTSKRMYDGAVDVAGADLAENTDHTLTVWAEDDKGGKSAEVTRKFRVVWNRPPTISGQNGDLGVMEAPPSVNYTVSDPETNPFTVTEKINGQVIRTFAGVAGRQETITIPHELWIRLEPGVQHALTIEASDDQGMTSTRTYTLTRFVDKIVFSMNYATMKPETKDFFTTDVAAKRLLLTPSWNLPPGVNLLVEACNNAYDAEPTWEDATIVVKLNRAHLFANESKTAEQWGINFRIKIEKGTAIGSIYVKGVGGAFD